MTQYISNTLSGLDYSAMIGLFIVLAFLFFGISLIRKSLRYKSLSLKISILIPLLIFLWGLIVWVLANLFGNLFNADFGGFAMFALMFGGIPLSLLSMFLAIFSFRSVDDRKVSIMAVFYAFAYLLLSIFILVIVMTNGM